MRSKTVFVLVVSLLGSLPYVASAQRPVNFSFGGGYTQPNAEVSDRLGGGFNFNIGLQGNVTPVIGIEGLYSFNGFGDKDLTLNVADNPGNPTIPTPFSGDIEHAVRNGEPDRAEAGRRSQAVRACGDRCLLSQDPLDDAWRGLGAGYCDPWWYVCYPGGWVETTNIIGDRSSTDFGMSFGGGVNFGAFYGELRYHYVWGPEVTVNQPTPPIAGVTVDSSKANGQFLQTTFGFRF